LEIEVLRENLRARGNQKKQKEPGKPAHEYPPGNGGAIIARAGSKWEEERYPRDQVLQMFSILLILLKLLKITKAQEKHLARQVFSR
jgi:hypothetical protein